MGDTTLPPQGLTQPGDPNINALLDAFETFKDTLVKSPLIEELKLLKNAVEKNTESTDENTETEENSTDNEQQQNDQQSSFLSNLFESVGDSFSRIGDQISSTTKVAAQNVTDAAAGAILGPMQLITKPLEEFTGFSIKDAIGGLIPKPFKGTPNRQKVLPEDPGAVYLGDLLKKIFGKDKEDESGLLGAFGKTGFGKLPLSAIMKGGAIAAIAGGLIWAAVDGIRGWLSSKKWGVSKVAGGLGGLLGGMDKGIKGAFKNMGKWALVGAGVGFMVGGPVGALAGGLIGGALGAVLGFIGGERISKALDKAFSWVGGLLNKIGEGITNIGLGIEKKYANFKKEHPKLAKLAEGIYKHSIFGSFSESLKNIREVFSDSTKSLPEKAKDIAKELLHAITMGFFREDSVFMNLFSSIQEELIPNLMENAKEKLKDSFDFITPIVESLKSSITGAFAGIFNFFDFIGNEMKTKGAFKGLGSIVKDFTVGGGKAFEEFTKGRTPDVTGEGFITPQTKEDILEVQKIQQDNAKELLKTQKELLKAQQDNNKIAAEKETTANVNVESPPPTFEKERKKKSWFSKFFD